MKFGIQNSEVGMRPSNQKCVGTDGRKIRNPNPPTAAEADQASSEGGGFEPPAGDGATRRPKADSKSEIRNFENRR
jgi:hypothetical protein